MALNANALTTLAQAKTYLKIPTAETGNDALVEMLINAASERLERDCDRVLKKRTGIVEYQDGRGQNIIVLKQYPITQVTELRLDTSSTFSDPSTIVPSTDYEITDDDNCILIQGRQFPKAYRSIKVTYSAGYDPIPSDLELACLWLVFWQMKIRDAQDIGRSSKSKEGESISYLQGAPEDVKDAIRRYKRTEFLAPNAQILNL